MDTDFHFFGTGTSALHAGFSGEQATVIANAAEYVDFYNSDYWSNWDILDKNDTAVGKLKYPQLSCQTIDWKMALDYDDGIWNAFHFPPGNLPHHNVHDKEEFGWEPLFKKNLVVRKTNLAPSEKPKLCRPFSTFALDMALDTIRTYKKIMTFARDKNAQGLSDFLGDISGGVSASFLEDPEKLALIFLGVRMHVFADTWAHQDFTGEASAAINGAGTLNYVYASKNDSSILSETSWTGTLWALHGDTDCAAAPNIPGSQACRGHGQMGHFPDYSWLHFIYPASWHPSGDYVVRNNPLQYRQAWQWLSIVMASCLGKEIPMASDSHMPGTLVLPASAIDHTGVPAEIQNVIAKPHALDDTKLFAVAESEQVWKKTTLAKNLVIEQRWNSNECEFTESMRKELGLIDGLAMTRYGSINVRKDSVLHYMQISSAMHYDWCCEWAKENPEFKWAPTVISRS